MMTVLPPSAFDPAGEEPLLAVACPSCHGAIAAPAWLAGRAAQCPICAGGFLVPLPPPPEPPKPRGELEFDDPANKTIMGDEGVIELRRLTPEEQAARRARRNVLMLLSGVVILMTIAIALGRKRRKT
jgi:hypothetical protein